MSLGSESSREAAGTCTWLGNSENHASDRRLLPRGVDPTPSELARVLDNFDRGGPCDLFWVLSN